MRPSRGVGPVRDRAADAESALQRKAATVSRHELAVGHADFAAEFLATAYADQPPPPAWAQCIALVEEAGEFAKAYRRATGWARTDGTMTDAAAELADVVICAYVMAQTLGVDLDLEIWHKRGAIMSRGFGTTPRHPGALGGTMMRCAECGGTDHDTPDRYRRG